VNSSTRNLSTGNSSIGNLITANSSTVGSSVENPSNVNLSTGNLSTGNLSTGNLSTGNLSDGNSSIGNLSAGNSSIGNLSTGNLSIGNLITANSSTVNSSILDSSVKNPSNVNLSIKNLSTENSRTGNLSKGNSSTVNSRTGNLRTGNSSTGESGENVSSISPSTNLEIGLLYREVATNVVAKELTTRNIANDNHVRFDFTENITCITYIEYDAERTFLKTTTTVEELKNKSIFVSELPLGRIYKHVNIWVGDKGAGLPTSLKNGIVAFKVEKTWINDSNVNESLIILQWYNNSRNSWEPLYTEKIGEDNNYAYFKSKTPRFSSFAITEYTGETGKNGIESSRKVAINRSVEKSGLIKNPMKIAKILMAISLPLFIAGYFVVRKKL
jgi:PGF-pre-PGF domain-containing protein